QLTKTYTNSGYAAKGIKPIATESSEEDANGIFQEVKSKRQLQKERRQKAKSPSPTPPTNARTNTPPPSNKRTAAQATTPKRRQKTSKIPKTVDLKYMQSYKATGKRTTWHPWLVASRISKLMGWFSQENLNYFAAYPYVAQDWMDKLPKEIYDRSTQSLRMDKQRGIHIPEIPDHMSILENHSITATPHDSLTMANLPPSLPRTIQVEYNT